MLKSLARFTRINWTIALIASIPAAILLWNTQLRIHGFEARQRTLMSAQVTAARREIESKLSQIQRQAGLFVDEQRPLLSRAIAAPDDVALHRQLQQKVMRYFPDYVGYTLATREGESFFKAATHPIPPQCQQDLLTFAASPRNSAASYVSRIHFTPGERIQGRHFDVMKDWSVADDRTQAIFLVALSDEYIARAMRNYEVDGNPLMLVDRNGLNQLQIHSRQRLFPAGETIRLSASDGRSILARAPVANSQWDLIALPNKAYFAEWRRRVWRDTTWMGGAMFAVIMLLVWRNRRESHRRRAESVNLNEELGAEIDKRKKTEASLRELSLYDALTGLSNRETMLNFLGHIVSGAERSGRHAAVLSLDIDHFRNINESIGAEGGDSLLKEVAQRLKRHVRRGDMIARWGEDEFVIVLLEVHGLRQASQIAKTLLNAIQTPFRIGTREVTATISIGIAPYPEAGQDPETLTRNARTAMSRAKQAGRNQYCFFSKEMNAESLSRLQIENELKTALALAQFELHYQPRFDTLTGKLKGAEALLRWNHPDFGLMLPRDFIDVLEETGIIESVGVWIMQTVSRHAQKMRASQPQHFRVAFNLTSREFSLPDLIARASQHLDAEVRGNLEVELNEGFLMAHTAENLVKLHALKQLELGLAIDDFGTGHSSLAYLRRFPVNVLKIDRSFVAGLPEDANDAALSNTIIQLAHNLGLKVVAVGVESDAQLEFLAKHRCDEVQGFLLGKPVAFQEFMDTYCRTRV